MYVHHVLHIFAFFFFLMIRLPPRSTLDRSSAASDVYKRQELADVYERHVERPEHEHDDDVGVAAENEERQPGTCLLYTSPSPRDRTRSRMPSSA